MSLPSSPLLFLFVLLLLLLHGRPSSLIPGVELVERALGRRRRPGGLGRRQPPAQQVRRRGGQQSVDVLDQLEKLSARPLELGQRLGLEKCRVGSVKLESTLA